MNSYAPGNTIRLLASFTNDQVAFNPITVVISVIGPNTRAAQTPAVVNDSTGNYHADVVATDPGLWQYRIAATGPASAAEGSFIVKQSQFVV